MKTLADTTPNVFQIGKGEKMKNPNAPTLGCCDHAY